MEEEPSLSTVETIGSTVDTLSSFSSTLPFDTEVNITVSDVTVDGAEYFYQVEQLTFLWVLFTFIVIGNATVLIALIMAKGRKSRMNFFIKHLAAADLCVGLISVLTDIIWKITISWEAGLVACKIIRFLQALVTYSSTYVLVALSIDRYDAITHPMNFSGSWRRAKVLVAAAWILSAVFSSPILYFYYTDEIPNYGTQCWINFTEQWQWQIYMTLVSTTLFVIPAILIAACYIIIVCTIWNKGKEMSVQPSSTSGNGAAPATGTADGATVCTTAGGNVIQVRGKNSSAGPREDEVESRRASSRGLIPKAKVKTVKMTFVIIFVFILCWSPYIFFDLLQVFGFIPDNTTNRAVATFIQSLAPLNSAANPLIYCLFSTNIGQTLCALLGCRKRAANLSTGMTTSTHSSSNKPSTVTANGNRNHHKNGGGRNGEDAITKPLLSNSVSISIASSSDSSNPRRFSAQRSFNANTELLESTA